MAALPDMGWDEAPSSPARGRGGRSGRCRRGRRGAANGRSGGEAHRVWQRSLGGGQLRLHAAPQKRDFSQQVCAADGKESAMEELVVDARAAGAAESSPAPRSAFQHRGFDRKMIELPIIEVRMIRACSTSARMRITMARPWRSRLSATPVAGAVDAELRLDAAGHGHPDGAAPAAAGSARLLPAGVRC
ncbi:hypothetical protein BOX15_Mlig007877g4 [Macrostomum lignano]|uniref:Uncharacterized protein n=1 Tax=Macrostomum lignano TaxID=282301 RepID=A0A267DYS3_9PLAT|nr:hypothetical protein BOX15_Mlig007877g4 [Macrostomum lignano]